MSEITYEMAKQSVDNLKEQGCILLNSIIGDEGEILIDAETEPHWINITGRTKGYSRMCSKCHKTAYMIGKDTYEYCPHCGTKMTGLARTLKYVFYPSEQIGGSEEQ